MKNKNFNNFNNKFLLSKGANSRPAEIFLNIASVKQNSKYKIFDKFSFLTR